MSESLRAIVEVLGPDTITTLVESTNKIAVVAGREFGLDVTADEITGIESVKLACLADIPLDLDKALSELREVPSVAARLKAKKDAERVALGHEEAIAGMTPASKIQYARLHGLTGKPEQPLGLGDHRAVIATLTGKAKLDYARRHGLA